MFFTIFFIFIFTQIISAQVYLNLGKVNEPKDTDTTYYYIKKVEIIGNRKTHPDIILRELLFSPNEYITLKQLIAAQKRVRSLALFTRVQFDMVGEKEYYTLIITVYERWYIFLYPTLYLNEKCWSKISYGASLRYYNFLGRNIFLKFKTVYGYNPLFKIIYHDPWFFGKNKIFTNLILFKRRVRNKSPAHSGVEDNRVGFEWVIGKRFGHFTFVGINLKYSEISASPELELTVSPSGKDKHLSVILGFQYDNRDLKEYTHKGLWLQFRGKIAGDNKWFYYYQYGTDLRSYLPVTQKITLAMRSATILSLGKIPIYDRIYFGYDERIRGRFP